MSLKIVLSNLRSNLHANTSSGLLHRLGLFLLLYFIGRYFFILAQRSTLLSTSFFYLHQPFLWIINKVSISFWSLFYHNVTSNSDYIICINETEIIQLLPGCSGLQLLLRITFILLLYPLPWKMKAWLFPLSCLIILFAATIHFIILIPIAYHWPEYYNFSHNWLTKIIFYGFYFMIWVIWERVGYPKQK